MRIAALDLGSNSVHLLVVEAHPDGTFEPLLREKEMLRLGDVVTRAGRVTATALDGLLTTVGRFVALARANGAEEIVANATAALREAENGADVVDRIEAATGVRVEVISGVEEARLIFGAVRASVVIEKGPVVGLDLGGGSLEVTVGDGDVLHWATSVRLGVARLTAELVSSDPVSGRDRRRLRQFITSVLAPVAVVVDAYDPRALVGTSGTLCDLAAMAVAATGRRITSSCTASSCSRVTVSWLTDSGTGAPVAATAIAARSHSVPLVPTSARGS